MAKNSQVGVSVWKRGVRLCRWQQVRHRGSFATPHFGSSSSHGSLSPHGNKILLNASVDMLCRERYVVRSILRLSYSIAGSITRYMYLPDTLHRNAVLLKFCTRKFSLVLQGKIQVRHVVVLSFLPCISETSVLANRISQNASCAAQRAD